VKVGTGSGAQLGMEWRQPASAARKNARSALRRGPRLSSQLFAALLPLVRLTRVLLDIDRAGSTGVPPFHAQLSSGTAAREAARRGSA
jgi:hypothetical protein